MIAIFLFLFSLIGWGWLVFGDHFTWVERRRELCRKYNEHWLTDKGLEWHNDKGQYFIERHCRACDYMQTKEVNKKVKE